jgi:uncharacterized protein
MTLHQQIVEDMKTAMKAKDSVTLNVVRNLKSALKYGAIEKLGADAELAEVDAIAVVRKELKKLQDLVEGVIAELGASSKKDMGGVMKALQERAEGRADSKLLSAEVSKRLS